MHLTDHWRGAWLAHALRPRWSVAPARAAADANKKQEKLPGGGIDEVRYDDPYANCQAIPQNTLPGDDQIAAVHYYLGHAFTDAARIEEGQQAFRALVCMNRYHVKDYPKDAIWSSPGKVLCGMAWQFAYGSS